MRTAAAIVAATAVLGFSVGAAQPGPRAQADAADQQSAEVRLHKFRGMNARLRHQLAKSRRVERAYKRLKRDYRTLGLYVSPRESAWLCIHQHEGAWTANTGNGYYGGLQMDRSFMGTYGPEFLSRWGTADRWPFWAQIKAADRAFAGRGFGPWPQTSRMCGLR